MKIIKYIALSLVATVLAHTAALAQTQPATPTAKPDSMGEKDPLLAQLQSLVEKVREKLKSGDTTEANFATELKEFDNLIANNPKADPDVLAQVELLKAMLYLQVFDETDKGTELLKKIKTDYPTSKIASRVDMMLDQISKQGEAKKIQAALKPG